jgi:hypothetical protein
LAPEVVVQTSSLPPGTPDGDHLVGSDQFPETAVAHDLVHEGLVAAAGSAVAARSLVARQTSV